MARKIPPFPAHSFEEWQVTIGDLLIPGRVCKAHVTKGRAGAKWDIKEGPGVNGATATFQGRKLAQFTITLEAGWQNQDTTIEDSHVLFWQIVRDVWAATAKGSPLSVTHPVLELVGVTSMLIEDIDLPVYEGQLLRTSFDCLQFAPPAKKAKSATATPTGPMFGMVRDVFLTHDNAGRRPLPPSATAPKP